MLTQLKGFGQVGAGSVSLPEIVVDIAHDLVARGKTRVKLDATERIRQGCCGTFLRTRLRGKAVRLQSIEGRSGRLFEWNVKLLHRPQRFAQLTAQLGCLLAYGV